jgi:glucose-6-phosphate isomerase
MKPIIYTHSLKKFPQNYIKSLSEEQKNLNETYSLQGSDRQYETNYASINVPFDKPQLNQIKKVIAAKKKLDIDTIIIIGIGGSNLGTLAIHQALNGLLYNETKKPQVFFADTTDPIYLSNLQQLIENKIKLKKNILLNIVTKSGSTIETTANLQVLVEPLKKTFKNYNDYIVVTTDKGSPLDIWAQQETITVLYIPKLVGGRYSVFTAVGLFSLGFIGINVEKLLKGAQDATVSSLQKNSIAQQSAAAIYDAYQNGYIIHDLFIFALNLEGFGKWYRQLSGESLGKQTLHDPDKYCSLTPTVSMGSADLHSVAQLYLGGKPPIFTTFIGIKKWNQTLKIKNDTSLKKLNTSIQEKTINEIMDAIFHGTMDAFKKQEINFDCCILPEINEYYMGNLLQTCMIQMIYLAKLCNVNPFNQPHVELYKKEIKKILNS